MRTTIDSAGRIVVPKPLRDALGFGPGEALEVEAHDGRLEVEVAPTPMKLSQGKGAIAAIPERELPPLTADEVRATLEQTRR
jgi:AbrB family looped-hinge helix DNA binding protein